MARNKTFKVTEHVSRLAVDFRPIGTFSGNIPEPSQQQFNSWTARMSELSAEYGYKGDPNDMVAISEYMAELGEEELDEQAERTAQAYADLCSGEPSQEQILELPPRYRQAFFGYLSGELAPEASNPAGQS